MSEYKLAIPVTEMDHIQGKSDAPLTLVEYGDYQCPYCGEAFPIVKKLQNHFGDKLRFVFRNFPLTQVHEYAQHAAETAEIAGEDGKFWQMHDMLYENQNNLDDLHLEKYSAELGIKPAEFTAKLASGEPMPKVKADFMGGVESGVSGTPAFFINGEMFQGSWAYESLKLELEKVLAESKV